VEKALISPSEIPWNRLKGKELEELIYWLFDSMGAQDMVWRVGGDGAGAADGGRDLELSLFLATPTGELLKQRWWIEAKGRSKTVEISEVQKAVLNSAGNSHVDVLVVATNARFSNSTRDWVSNWQASHPRPIVKLWERTELENHCCKNPSAVARVYAHALSPQGKLEFAKTRFLNSLNYLQEPMLEMLWESRQELQIDSAGCLVLISSETCNGDLIARRWGNFLNADLVANAVAAAFRNFLYFACRAEDFGSQIYPVEKALRYLIHTLVRRVGPEVTHDFLQRFWNEPEYRDLPEDLRSYLKDQIVSNLTDEFLEACSLECKRMSVWDPVILTNNERENYWQQFAVTPHTEEKKPNKGKLIAETIHASCVVGLDLCKTKGCPLAKPPEDLRTVLQNIHQVSKFRVPE
jgi:hypothetical protein